MPFEHYSSVNKGGVSVDNNPERISSQDVKKNHSFKKVGRLKIIIGAAPGSGKTYKMLKEANDLSKSGVKVVIGFLELHHREKTAKQIGNLEVVPHKKVEFQNRTFQEMDVDRILACHPSVVLVDELAHTNITGSRFSKRYMDIIFLLEHGIDVLTTVNVQHLEEVYRDAEKITGTRIREIVPQSFIERADEIEVVDVPPETLRQRMRDGDIFPKSDVNQALNHYFKKTNLSLLRELALRVVADTVDTQFQKSFERKNIPGPVGAKEVILVCTSFLARSAILIRKGYRMTSRLKAELLILTILEMPEHELPSNDQVRIDKLKSLANFCHARYLTEQRNDRPTGQVIQDVAERLSVTQIVVGQTSTSQHRYFWKPDPVNYLLLHMNYADLHIVGWKNRGRPYQIENSALPEKPVDRQANRGRLTIYIGSAPGVGKTYKMLQDANEWFSKGMNVVIGVIETHGRQETAKQIDHLPLLPKRVLRYDGHYYEELDVEGIVHYHPQTVLVDELAHTNAPGSKHNKRYLDVIDLLNHGIDVVTAVNIQHLESLRDTVEHVTGIKVMERVPDWFMDMADQIRLIDVTPKTLQQRLIQGKIYSGDRIERAMNHFFRLSNLSVLRELALFEVADNVDQRLDLQPKNKGVPGILTCVNYRPHSEKLIRRGWRLADRYQAPLYVLAVLSNEPLTVREKKDLEILTRLSEQFQATFLEKRAAEKRIGEVIVKTAKELQVEQIVVGQPLPAWRFFNKFKRNPVTYVLRHAEFVNLHVVAISRGESDDPTEKI